MIKVLEIIGLGVCGMLFIAFLIWIDKHYYIFTKIAEILAYIIVFTLLSFTLGMLIVHLFNIKL